MAVSEQVGNTDARDAALPKRWGRAQRIKNTLIYLAIRIALAVLRSAPRGMLRVLGTTFGHAAFYVAAKDRIRACEHLRQALPELGPHEVRSTARRMFVYLGRSALDALVMDRLVGEHPDFKLPAPDQETFRTALAEGHGVVAIGGHIGNWELCAQAIAAAGLPLSVIASPLYDPRLTRLVDRFRSQHGMRVLWRGDSSVSKDMLRVFKRGEILAMLIDQDTKVQGTFVPFFGRPAYTPTAAAQLALRFRAPIVLGFVLHQGRGYRYCFERFHYPDDATAESLTAQLTARIESVIREDLAQWVWLHRRWRRS